jgi:hypothetical protein
MLIKISSERIGDTYIGILDIEAGINETIVMIYATDLGT